MPHLKRESRHAISFVLDDQPVTGYAEPRLLLSDFLRETFAVNAVHVGCEHGVCGSCTVRIDGKAVRACLTFAVQVEGKREPHVMNWGFINKQ